MPSMLFRMIFCQRYGACRSYGMQACVHGDIKQHTCMSQCGM